MKNPFDLVAGWHLQAMMAAGALAVAGGLYGSLWLGKQAVEKDRGLIVASFENVCASAGVPYRVDVAGKPLARKLWGKNCAAEILRVFTERAGAAQAALTTVVNHNAGQVAKGVTYRAAAHRSTSRIQSGQQKMETAIVTSQDGLVGPGFFNGLNQSLGLRPYIAAGPAAASGDRPEGDAGRGSAEVQRAPDGVLAGSDRENGS
jgi:hypothetical protein